MLSKDELKTQLKLYFNEQDRKTLEKWHRASVQGDYGYVIFVIRRSYVIALAMEKITDARMVSSKTVYLTDGAVVNYCTEFVEYYKKNRKFPKILLVDDILEYGRNINGALEKLMRGIKEILLSYGDEKEDNWIYRALAESVTINVLAKVRRKSLVLDLFRNNINICSLITMQDKHALSSNLGLFVNAIDIANASYIFSSQFKTDSIECNLTPVITKYQGCVEKTYIDYIGIGSTVCSVITLRLLKVSGTQYYRAIPYIILPDLSFNQRERLVQYLIVKIQSGNYKYLSPEILLKKNYSTRTINEWTLMILSNAILNEYRSQSGLSDLETKDDIEKEAEKLSRNYCRPGFDAKLAILEMIDKPPVVSVLELKSLLAGILNSHNNLFSYSVGDALDEGKIKSRIENLFYNFEYKDTVTMYDYAENNVVMDRPIPCKYVRKLSDVMGYIADGHTYKESRYMTAYLLQMMDGGFINASINDREIATDGTGDTIVYNLQNAKVAEQSQVIFPLRVRKYIPMLADMWRTCEYNRLKMEDHMRAFGKSAYCGRDISEVMESLITLYKVLVSIGETPEDININYFGRTDLYYPDDVFNTRINRMIDNEEIKQIRESYKAYKASL